MSDQILIQLFQVCLPIALYFIGCYIAKGGFIDHRKKCTLLVERRTSKVDLMFEGVERRS